jgi:arabinofuranan 3-O-arabinosyltransferase
VLTWGAEQRSVQIAAGAATYLEIHQNYNPGWTATMNGETLTPIVLDGWQQGFEVPAGGAGVISMTFTPERPYLIGYGLGLLLAALLLLLGVFCWLFRRSRRWRAGAPEAAPIGRDFSSWFKVAVGTAVVFVAGGAMCLAVPLLALIRRYRPALVSWIAAGALAAAGVVAAWVPGFGAETRLGAFSLVGQALALVGIAAVLTPITTWPPRRSQARPAATGQARSAARGNGEVRADGFSNDGSGTDQTMSNGSMPARPSPAQPSTPNAWANNGDSQAP